MRGGGEVDAHRAGAEGSEHDFCVRVGVKTGDSGVALADGHGSVEAGVSKILVVEMGLEHVQERRPLGEDDGLCRRVALPGFGEDLHDGRNLGGTGSVDLDDLLDGLGLLGWDDGGGCVVEELVPAHRAFMLKGNDGLDASSAKDVLAKGDAGFRAEGLVTDGALFRVVDRLWGVSFEWLKGKKGAYHLQRRLQQLDVLVVEFNDVHSFELHEVLDGIASKLPVVACLPHAQELLEEVHHLRTAIVAHLRLCQEMQSILLEELVFAKLIGCEIDAMDKLLAFREGYADKVHGLCPAETHPAHELLEQGGGRGHSIRQLTDEDPIEDCKVGDTAGHAQKGDQRKEVL